MEKILNYFTIEGALGGSQDWFTNVVMNIGGCAAATACDSCIYFALHQGQKHLYPYDVEHLTKKEYVQFAMKMKPYIKPRMGGVKKLSMFIDGFSKYLRDVGDTRISMNGFAGDHTADEAKALIKKQIDAGFPIPYLMLKHRNPKYKDFVWHWFLCFGYEEKRDGFFIKVATYGTASTFVLKDLWNTGYEEKGGLIQYTAAQ
ncbi:hypothetical protein [Muricomes intestini]|jgi:hypothetical protein|uniref:Papain like cysteine protease AvrRpt2 n=1 Tax=Muricomes intestini TaxID=1796634 RepID=A0A4R3KFR9_9FIRM|nr:hypothetical protein [Muricomes intestini]TCS82157.1 hypothetical protein EDD59_10218 [Muricomes intestini]HCR84323.1 hypothetical protein [Lachnospiraceae bacterium]